MRNKIIDLLKSSGWRFVSIVVIFSIASFVSINLFLFQANAQSLTRTYIEPKTINFSSSTTYLSAITKPKVSTSPTEKDQAFEIHIANNGIIFLSGAHVVSRSGDTFRAVTSWDTASFVWKVQTSPFVDFTTTSGRKITPSDIRTGDIVTITGKLMTSGEEPTISAQFVKKLDDSSTN